jgi:type II secretory pathway pseudopilin PulG
MSGSGSTSCPRLCARSDTRGFTIFELLNLVALIGILSAIGMYALARYVRHSKTAEAIGSLTTLAHQTAAYYDASDATQPAGTTPDNAHAMRHFPPSSTASVPPKVDDIRGKKYQSTQADWAASPWHELQFSIPQPQYYAYSYVSEGAGATAKATAFAKGDLDSDGNVATYSITVTPDANYHAQVAAIVKEDPDE